MLNPQDTYEHPEADVASAKGSSQAVTAAKPSTASKMNTSSDKPSPGAALSEKIKHASKIAAVAKAAKKQNAAPAGKKEQASYELLRPPKGKFVRVHPSEDYRMHNIPVLECPDTHDLYFFDENVPGVPDHILEQVRRINVYVAQTHDHSVFLWIVKQSDTPWYKAARRAVSIAVNKWVSVRAKNALNTYELTSPVDTIPEPNWDGLPAFDEMLDIAFDERSITYPEHPVLKTLQGILDDDDDSNLI